MNRIIRPRLFRWLLFTGIFFLLLMTVLRLIFFIAFRHLHLSWAEAWPSFVLGIRYDLRIICVLLMIMLIVGSIHPFNPYESSKARKIWWWILGIFVFFFSFFYIADFAHYAYLSQRLNASVLNFLEDAGISAKMVWQSYPVIKLLLTLAISVALILWAIKQLYKKASTRSLLLKRSDRVIGFIAAFLIFCLGIFGRTGQYPLRWSFAFSLGNDYKANLALNPLQSFFSTLKFRSSTYDLAKTKQYYSLIEAHLGVQQPNSEKLNFSREYPAKENFTGIKPNIVLVICESFSAYKSSMWGNPLNTTPYFNEMCKSGIFFNHCFTPSFGTARGVWATITGIPDVEMPKTASRNMAMVSQNTIINDFNGYEKLYFIGGSATWANIRGLLMNNIDSLHLYEGDDYKASKIDVWGISDKNLFLESNKILKQQTRPFFAVIQTADNHRPYTIPKEDEAAFKKINFPTDTLHKYGFENNDEMNAFRYADFGYQQFIESAKKEKYFNNTIFIFVGDHGIRGSAGEMFPKAWTDQSLTAIHVPLLFYSPALLKPDLKTETCSQIDILPSAAALAGRAYQNNTLGRNLFDSSFATDTSNIRQCSFFIDHDTRQIGIISNDYYYTHSLRSGKEQFVSVKNNDPVGNTAMEQKKKEQMHLLTDAYFETSKYLLFNNKRK
jgi:phosphoglycerol transferase MdoB-like AlkP superfamily enzyme